MKTIKYPLPRFLKNDACRLDAINLQVQVLTALYEEHLIFKIFQNLNQGLSKAKMILSRTGSMEEAQKGIWNICFFVVCYPACQRSPIWIYLVLDSTRKVWNKHSTKSKRLQQGLGRRKQALGGNGMSGLACCRVLRQISLLRLSPFRFIHCTVTRVTFLEHKSDHNSVSA